MYEPPPDPSAVTQPIPVVSAPPPRPPGVAGTTTTMPPSLPPVQVAPRFVHRFGSLPFYLFGRFGAFLIDVFGIGFVLATFGFQAFDAGFFTLAGHNEAGFDALAGISLAAAFLLAFLCESLFGTTLGKLVFALHVWRGNGGPAGAVRIFVRYLLRPVDLLLIGPLLALITPRHQRIGDFLSGTVVSRSRIGAFASLLGIVLLVAVGYAQVVAGGGLTSAVGVVAETADYAPALYARAASAFGFGTNVSPRPQTQPTELPTPQPQPSDVTNVQ